VSIRGKKRVKRNRSTPQNLEKKGRGGKWKVGARKVGAVGKKKTENIKKRRRKKKKYID